MLDIMRCQMYNSIGEQRRIPLKQSITNLLRSNEMLKLKYYYLYNINASKRYHLNKLN